MTSQQVFNRVAKHLLKQGKRAKRGKTCAYRGDNGLQCAVGCLIPDSKYHARMEGYSVEVLVEENWLPKNLREHSSLLKDLQFIHDCKLPFNWRPALRRLAESRKLDPGVLSNV